ncbi:uncharacterized protein BX663DRAFT_560086 [Cokeromyces recurvatus]|uniref:uncharacterized protein n=1 Tax=Cokeromyces recurvatus TaxID=90255 RepID=UPI00221F9023|nr:uncharacterized protein BX663DRAFT_560086 [Cokeromyces recurvatus]KAI7904405.1 hypothetical protein BX663DRAFT_560086 [Cokeromyces recurvatus]
MQAKSSSTLRRGGNSSRRAIRTLNPAYVYDYTLRCAIHACLEHQSKQKLTSSVRERRTSNSFSSHRHSVHLSGVSDVFGNIADKFASDDATKDKLTKPVVVGLMRRLDDIKEGRDVSKTEYLDRRFISIVKQVRDIVKQHRYRPQGSINDLLVTFLRTSEAELKKSDPNPAVWFKDLDNYVVLFTEVLLLVLKEDAPNSASAELISTLNKSILPPKSKKKQHIQEQRNSNSSSNNNSNSSSTDIVDIIENFPMVKTVQNLFQIENSIHRQKIHELQSICTESNFFLDLKQLINAVNINQSFPGRREDFASQQAYDAWVTREKKYLQGLMTVMVTSPSFSLNISNEQDVGSTNLLSGSNRKMNETKRNSIYGSSSSLDDSPYTYIPNDPRSYFRLLMNMCMDLDTKIAPDTERAKSSLLSQASEDLLRECWTTWRLSPPFRAVLYLETIKNRMDTEDFQNEYDILDVRDAMRALDKCLKENEIRNWTINDRENLIRVFEGLNETCLRYLADSLSQYWRINPEFVKDQIDLLDNIYENPAYLEDHSDPYQHFNLLEETIAGAAVSRWRVLEKSVLNPKNDDMTNLMHLADKLIKELVGVAKKFKKPLKNALHLPSIVMARQMPFFVLEMENWAFLPEARNAPIDLTFQLYDKVLTLKRLYDQYGPKQKSALFKVESWFLLHVKRWLKTTAGETPEWVSNAIKQDEFKAVNETTPHSSSIVDLFTMFYQAVDFVQKLEWPNRLQECYFNTALSKVIGVALEQYTMELEEMITMDIYPRYYMEEVQNASANFFDRARYQLIGNRTHGKAHEEPYDFMTQTCVRINNIEVARIKLDRLYQNMDVDEIAQVMREYESQLSPSANEKATETNTNYLYSIKIVRAENLPPADNNGLSDPYIVLEIDSKPVARTRTVYETLNPRWDQVFDIWLTDETVDVLALVYDEDVIGADEECGGVWFKLGPSYYGDFQTHELVLNFNPQGRLILRVSMEGEKDDIQFWFGKAFRVLKRAENDAAGLIVDKMGSYFRQILNRKSLDKLLGRDRSFFSSFSRSNKHIEPTLQDCEDSIAPLLDYLEKNLKTLNDNLSETNMQFVILRIWREILISLENVLLPPLSEQLSEWKPLDDYEFHVVYKWLELLKILFNGGEDGDAVPLDKLENSQYYALLAINAAYNLDTDQLIEAYNSAVKNQLELKLRGGRKADRSKSVYHSKNTVKKRKSNAHRKSASIDLPNSDTILRILRMRSGRQVRDFLHTEFEKRNNPTAYMNLLENNDQKKQLTDIPPVPSIPTNDLSPITSLR